MGLGARLGANYTVRRHDERWTLAFDPPRASNLAGHHESRDGSCCTPGSLGEIWASSPSVCAGHSEREEESQEKLRAALAHDPNTYLLRTGDLG